MGDFSQLSRFNPDANFKLVRIGADSPVLEVELNEMQDISEARYKNLIHSYFGDAVQGEGTYLYQDGVLTIKDESAFVGGNVIEITTLKLPLVEGEKAYLKVWEQTIKTGDLIKYKGNEQETRTVVNTLLDERVGRETSRRIQLKYDMAKTTDEHASYFYLGKILNGKFHLEASILSEASTKVTVDKLISKGSQKVFTTTSPFKMGVNSLSVYINGIYQTPHINFIELSSTSFELAEPVEQGAEIVAVYSKLIKAKSTVGHNEDHSADGADPIDILDLADKTGLLDRIQKKLEMKVIDCGYFNDEGPSNNILDGGVF